MNSFIERNFTRYKYISDNVACYGTNQRYGVDKDDTFIITRLIILIVSEKRRVGIHWSNKEENESVIYVHHEALYENLE